MELLNRPVSNPVCETRMGDAVASASPVLDAKAGDEFFAISAQLRHGDTAVSVSFDECLLTTKSFEMSSGGHGETVGILSGRHLLARTAMLAVVLHGVLATLHVILRQAAVWRSSGDGPSLGGAWTTPSGRRTASAIKGCHLFANLPSLLSSSSAKASLIFWPPTFLWPRGMLARKATRSSGSSAAAISMVRQPRCKPTHSKPANPKAQVASSGRRVTASR